MELDGRVVVVTGGTRGVGAGIARSFLAAGADVVVCARRPLEQTVSADGRKATFTPVDLRDPAAVQDFFGAVANRYGRLDCLVNNAGGTRTGCWAKARHSATHGSSNSTCSPR